MRTTVLFVTLLVFVSCSKLSPKDVQNAFVQMSSNPKAEAIFATMAVHMKSEKGGFDRILGLLTSLVSNARDQDHRNTLIYRKTETLCRVARYSLHERQEFFDNTVRTLQHARNEAQRESAQAQNLEQSRERYAKMFNNIYGQIRARNAAIAKYMESQINEVKEAEKRITSSVHAVTNREPTPAHHAFVQKSIEEVADSYAKIKKMKLYIPTNFVQTNGRDPKVRNRMLEWLGELRGAFVGADHEVRGLFKTGEKLAHKVETETSSIAKGLAEDGKRLGESVKATTEIAKHTATAVGYFKDLAVKNAKIAATAKQWCSVEKVNYTKVHKAVQANIKLFKEVRDYFVDHYKQISEFIMNKYH